jgi:hypothetical protein
MWRTVLSGFAILALCAASTVSAATPSSDDEVAPYRLDLYKRFKPNLSAPLESRLQTIPGDVLELFRTGDAAAGIVGSKNYVAHAIAPHERELFRDYLAVLPKGHRELFQQKLMAIFVVDSFGGAGLVDWLVDAEGEVHYYLLLNGALFSQSLDEWLTAKEDSFFDRSFATPKLRVRTGTAYRALLYGLLHEGTHIVDFDQGLTPWVEPGHRAFTGRQARQTPFTQGVWWERKRPLDKYDFAHRDDLNVYGLFSDRSLIPRSAIRNMFEVLKATPFVGFYAGSSWNEDLADYFMYFFIEQKLHGKVRLELVEGKTVVNTHVPFAKVEWTPRLEVVSKLAE